MKLYYGNGKCSIEGGVENMGLIITYSGAVQIDDLTPDGYAIDAGGNKIVIFFYMPINVVLADLFNYIGTLKIIKVEVGDINGIIPVTIHKVMDYSELLNSNAEDMTTFSEDLSSGYTANKKITKTVLKQKIIPNLDTKESKALILPDGSVYSGAYHIHLMGGDIMTGSQHTSSSIILKQERLQRNQRPVRYPPVNVAAKKISPKKFGSARDTDRISPQRVRPSGGRLRGLIAIKEHCHCIGAVGPEMDTPMDTYQNIIHGVCPTYTTQHECAGAFLPGTDDEDLSNVACIWYCGTQSPYGRQPYMPEFPYIHYNTRPDSIYHLGLGTSYPSVPGKKVADHEKVNRLITPIGGRSGGRSGGRFGGEFLRRLYRRLRGRSGGGSGKGGGY